MNDKSFLQMSALLHAVWPAVAAVDWSEYCNDRVSAYNGNTGIPNYTGLLMHRAGGGCIGGTTVAVGFLPRPEKSAIIVADKTRLILNHPEITASMERRNPDKNLWGGGVRCSTYPTTAYAITMLPEIGDHLLTSSMMKACGELSDSDWHYVSRSDWIVPAREYVGMETATFAALRRRISTIVRDALPNIHKAA